MTVKYYLLDGRDAYNYNWTAYSSIDELFADKTHFTQYDWEKCKVVKGQELAIGLKPTISEPSV